MAKNILQKYFDGTDWIDIHPVTKTSNVFNSEGKNVDELITSLTTVVSNMQVVVNNISNPFTMDLYSDTNILELGITIDSINFTWNYNRIPHSQQFEGTILDNAVRAFNYTTAINSSKLFTLSAVPYDGGSAVIDTTNIQFLNGVYYGVSSSVIYDGTLIGSLTKDLSDTKSRTINVNAGATEYIYYCIPTRLGEVSFKVGGFDGGFMLADTIAYTNASGYTENYYIYRSDNLALGSTSVVIQ